ncbi:proline iminopeptidase [Bombilactobacillus mellifer]|uniref:proline iminopeptidase n=1 Tax=Bombilactobacillus mellifer TaxID=1218492 RepID=UPI0023F17E61|nr:proline iminopeptidase-family hydrolase [Bombilactobacillus mellifer]MCT6825768.1 proline iminopeptidase-family hydrolase [Bombilactobacillus mellifer]
MLITEGYLPFGPYRTYYRIVGKESAQHPPLLLLHGGPGSTHNYFEVLDTVAQTSHRQLIMYDQLGCGNSSCPDQPQLWRAETWVQELINLRQKLHLTKIHLLGQSWGGMLALIYLCDYHPQGIQSLILASTLSNAQLWAQEQQRLIKFLPIAEQTAINQAQTTGNYQASAYQAANAHYMQLHAAPKFTAADPEPLRRKKHGGTQAYAMAWGPNEYTPSGTLKNYDYTQKLAQLKQPTLITSGTNDLSTPLINKTMWDQLPHAHWELFAHSRHLSFVEENQKYQHLLTNWLLEHD